MTQLSTRTRTGCMLFAALFHWGACVVEPASSDAERVSGMCAAQVSPGSREHLEQLYEEMTLLAEREGPKYNIRVDDVTYPAMSVTYYQLLAAGAYPLDIARPQNMPGRGLDIGTGIFGLAPIELRLYFDRDVQGLDDELLPEVTDVPDVKHPGEHLLVSGNIAHADTLDTLCGGSKGCYDFAMVNSAFFTYYTESIRMLHLARYGIASNDARSAATFAAALQYADEIIDERGLIGAAFDNIGTLLAPRGQLWITGVFGEGDLAVLKRYAFAHGFELLDEQRSVGTYAQNLEQLRTALKKNEVGRDRIESFLRTHYEFTIPGVGKGDVDGYIDSLLRTTRRQAPWFDELRFLLLRKTS